MDTIIGLIETYKEDHPEVYITNSMIEELINEYKELLIKEIRELI